MKLFAWVALLFSLALPVRAQDKLWGVGLHLGGAKSDYETAKAMLTGLGANTFRDDIYWNNVEQKKWEFSLPRDLADSQKMFVLGPDSGLRGILVLLYGNHLWFNGLPKNDADRNAYALYVEWVARGYGKSVAAFEIWNEWNIGGGSDPREEGTPEEYMKLVKRVQPILRREAPKTPILCGGVANRQMGWIERFAELGGFTQCDGFSIHPYNHHDPDSSAEDVVRWLDELNGRLKAKAKKSVPVWVTEIGWPNHDGVGGSTEATTAQRLLKMNIALATRGYIRGVWWYDMFDDGDNPKEMEHNFGLVRIHGDRKPAYDAFKYFIANFAKAKPIKEVSAENVLGYEFKTPQGKRLVAVWAREGSVDKQVAVTGGWKLIKIRGSDGDRVTQELKKSGSAHLGVWPVVLELEKDAKLKLSTQSAGGGCAP